MPISPTGQIIDQQGNPTGGQVNLNTGQTTAPNTYSPATSPTTPSTPPVNTSITGADLTSTQTPNYQTPKPTPPESISGLTYPQIPAQSTPPLEQKAQDLTSQIQDIQNSLLGKETFERGLQQQAGIPEKNQAILDYQTRLDELKKKEAVIQTQYGGSLAANQGVLEPFVTGEKDARLRQNAIEALTVSANIDAMHGLITSAQSKVDRAVQEKYGPDEERLKIAQANLDTLVKSGSLTREQERQAQNQQLVLRQQENNLAIERNKVLEAQKLAIQVAANNPNINSQTLQSMQQAKSAFDVLNIAQNAGLSVNPNLSKQTTDTVFNLAQTYPDAGILPNDTLQQAQSKVTSSPLFKAHLGQVESGRYSLHTDPNTGLAVLLNTKTGETRNLNSVGTGGTGGTGISAQPTGTGLGPVNAQGKYDSVLQTLSPAEQATVKLLSNYAMPLPQGFALKSPYFQRLLGVTAQYDPTFDASKYTIRLNLRNSFTSGTDSQNLLALNTVTGHLKTLQDATNNLGIGRYLPYSSKYESSVNNFNLAKNAVANELAKVFRATGGSERDVQDWKDSFSKNSTKGVLNDAIQQAINLMGSRLYSLSQKYESGVGRAPDFTFLNDHSVNILKGMGVNVNEIDPTIKNTNSGTSQTTRMIGPDGSQWNVPNDKIDIFKQNGYK